MMLMFDCVARLNDFEMKQNTGNCRVMRLTCEKTILICILTLLLCTASQTSPNCEHYGSCRFLPAPPGKSPKCAKSGSTFCEKVDHYPVKIIRYLIDRWGFDYGSLLNDEAKDQFSYRTPEPYGHPGYSYGPARPQHSSALIPHYQLLNYSSNTGGYPDRRYPLPHSFDNPLLFTTLYQQSLPQYSPEEWWLRFARSSNTHSRYKRQSSPNQNKLCQTTTRFVMPRAAMNNRGNWMYVVNLNDVDNRYTQLVGTETCTSTQCSGLCSIPNGYTSRCEQQYVQKRLVALGASGDRLYSDIFWIPHCCLCQITQVNG